MLKEEIKERDIKIENNLKKKIEEQEEKKYLIQEKEKKKEEIKKQFDLMTKENEKEIDIEKIKELFPDDENLHKHLEDIKNEYAEKERNIIENYNKNKQMRHIIAQKDLDNIYNKIKDLNDEKTSPNLNKEQKINNKDEEILNKIKNEKEKKRYLKLLALEKEMATYDKDENIK